MFPNKSRPLTELEIRFRHLYRTCRELQRIIYRAVALQQNKSFETIVATNILPPGRGVLQLFFLETVQRCNSIFFDDN